MHRLILLLPALLAIAGITWYAGLRAGFLLVLGLGFGAALSGARFGFTTGWRDLLDSKDPWGMIGQMVLLALCAALAFPLLTNHANEIVGAVSPISWSLLIGALVFGFAMQLADGCGSGTLYKAGAASPTSWVVLPAFIAGSFLGASHQPAWVSLGGPLQAMGLQPDLQPIDLIDQFGLKGALVVTLLGCLAIALTSLVVAVRHARRHGRPLPAIPQRWLWGALFLALLYAAHLVVAGQPWGIVYGLGLWGAKVVTALGIDLSSNAFWGVTPHAQRLAEPVLWDITSVTNIGLLYGALIAARWNQPRVKAKPWPGLQPLIISVAAGLLMGYASRLAFGCNVGAYLGGIASASLHGWVWLLFAFIGSIYGVKLRKKAGIA